VLQAVIGTLLVYRKSSSHCWRWYGLNLGYS